MTEKIQLYWDTNTGVCVYNDKRKFYKVKPDILGVDFDSIVYDSLDGVALKVLNGTTKELTTEEIATISLFCQSNAEEEIVTSIGAHNTDPLAHHDIRVSLSNLSELSHKVATVWSGEKVITASLKNTSWKVDWTYILNDTVDCTLSTIPYYWKCPVSESYDITVQLGFSGLDLNAGDIIKVSLISTTDTSVILKEGTYAVSEGSKGAPCIQMTLSGATLPEGAMVSVECVLGASTGILLPSRSFLRIDNHGSEMAKRVANYYFSTLGNMVFYKGYQLSLKGDSSGTPQLEADTWNTEVYELQ